MIQRPVGLTRDVGWQVGVSRTFPVTLEAVWELLTSPPGLALWLGEGVRAPLTTGTSYQTSEGTTGEVRSVRPRDRVRLTWHPSGRDAPATLQVTVAATMRGCAVRFHTEHLTSERDREAMRQHWREILDRLDVVLR